MQVLKQPSKLTEIELYNTLLKIVEMPEKRFKQLISEGGRDNVNEIFLVHVLTRVP